MDKLYTVQEQVSEQDNRLKWSRHFDGVRREVLETGKVPLPSRATLELTMRCNLKCQMCFRDKGVSEELNTEELKRVIDNLGGIEKVHLTGGEVFLRKDIFEILDYLGGKKVSLNTNGTLLTKDKVAKLSKYDNITRVGFSLDGLSRTHDRIRGLKHAFEKTIEAIKLTSEAIPVSVNSMVLDENMGELDKLLALSRKLSAEEFRVELEMYSTPEDIQVSKTLLSSNNCPIVTQVKVKDAYEYQIDKFIEVKERLKRLSSEMGMKIGFGPKAADIDAKEFYNGRIREQKKLICKHLLAARVNPTGNLIFCHTIKKSFGNLLEIPLEEIWDAEELKDFRKNLLEHNLLPICKRCCRLRSI